MPGYERVGPEPRRDIVQIQVSHCQGKAALGDWGLGQTGRRGEHGQEASDRRLLGWLEILMMPSERPEKGIS